MSPPWFALALLPLTWLPLDLARGLWLACNLALLIVTTAACARLVDLAWPPRQLLLAAFLLGLWPPVEFGLKLGQNSLLVWALVLAALHAACASRYGATGALLALALVKPQLVCFFGLGLAVLAARERALPRFLGAAVGVAGTLAVAVLFLAPDAYADLLALRPRTWNYWGSTIALPPLLASLLGSQPGGIALYLPIAIGGSLALARQWARAVPADLAYVAALTACATLLLTPYAYPYDAVLLQLPLLWLVATATPRCRVGWPSLLALAALTIAALWLLERPADYTAWRLLGLLPPLALLLALPAARRALS